MIVSVGRPSFARTVLGPIVSSSLFAKLGYLLLGLPLGIFSFVVVVTGLSLGAGLAVTVAGIPVLLVALACCRALAEMERSLAEQLLGAPMPRRVRRAGSGGMLRRLARDLRSGTTWRELAFLVLRLPLGIATFSVAVTVVGGAAWGIFAPLMVALGVPLDFGDWQVEHAREALVFVPPGLALGLAAPGLIELLALWSQRFATALLGHVPRRELKLALGNVLAREGTRDPDALLCDLTLVFGRGPYLSRTRVEAVLLALVEAGLVERHGEGYALSQRGRSTLQHSGTL